MSIYSANRTGSMTMSQITANEAYSDNDLGRIMFESQVNDMAIFEAVLACDFREIQGLREGTILESEVKKLNKEYFQQLAKTMVAKLKEFWAKIKGALQVAIRKIAAYCLRDGKAFADDFEAVYKKNIDWKGTIEKGSIVHLKQDFNARIGSVENVLKVIENHKNDNYEGVTVNDIVRAELSAMIAPFIANIDSEDKKKLLNGDDVIKTVADYTKCLLLGNTEKKEEFGKNEIAEMLNNLRTGKDYVKTLNDIEKKYNNAINDCIKVVIAAEKNVDKDSDNGVNSVKNLKLLVSAYEMVVSASVRAEIALVKCAMNNSRKMLGAIKHDIIKKDKNAKAQHEAAAIEDQIEADKLEDAFDVAPEANEEVDTLVAAAVEE